MIYYEYSTRKGRLEMLVLVIEKEEEFRRGLTGKGWAVTGADADGLSEILASIQDYAPDLVIVDLSVLPDRSEDETARKIRKEFPRLGIVGLKLFPRFAATQERVRFLNAGGDYLLYQDNPDLSEELEACVRALMRRMYPTTSAELSMRCGDTELLIDRVAREVMFDGRPVELTTMEFKVLSAIATAYPKRMSMGALIDELYFSDPDPPNTNTVAVFIFRIRKKLGSEVIQNTKGLGYRLRGPGEAS